MIVIPLIERKRDGEALTTEEWVSLMSAYAAGDVPDYQMAALLMAVLLNGLDPHELAALTDGLWRSGRTLAFGDGTTPRVDKHSTGGVGDKTSLVLAPLVASMGAAVPMISGRALGHTGGTLDKLESIPGFRTDLSVAEMQAQVERIGVAMVGQTAELAPADRRLYALRDATATVEAIPLMAASIVSKKMAEDLAGLVVDVKRGSGAFLPELEETLELAQLLVRLGTDNGCPTVALLTAMDRPLGRACGNALEVEEAIAALRGEGPPDLMELVYREAAEMLTLVGLTEGIEIARADAERAVTSGRAAAKLQELLEAQGGNPNLVDDPAGLPQAPVSAAYEAPQEGWIEWVDPRTVGLAVVTLGGGRQHITDRVDPAVGVVVTAKPGNRVEAGQPLASVHARDEAGIAAGCAALAQAIRIGDEVPPGGGLPLISHRVTAGAVEILA
jgi:pyrimidine-nucleoside phosphorylase